MRRVKFIYILITAIFILFIFYAYAGELPKWFPFNKKDALEEWKEKIFKNKVIYTVEPVREGGYLSAKSKESCSGLLYRITFSPEKRPMISWYWKVTKFPNKTAGAYEGGWIEKDDYAARVYVIFPHISFTKIQSIEYIWDEKLAEGTIMTSPYFENIKLIVAESGRENMNKWVFEKRNIYDDYEKAFGEPPKRKVGAISLMTDTDNTLSTAEALYKNIKVGYKNE